ncbi:VOC family protein [Conexibacter sp. CPCC 206217]|uniref:VOC family protein n=1 Tax=Conexibacter sp. CPCC 206217 TaxID=3064574 RepID=UPI00271C2485|nr:VOC family protein [Conexibacter sp. CPCC 206217]MDO8213247.1 VOC family protein [Conexibacter sp. CPCC 206217]
MFDHVTLRVSDRDAAERFYSTVLAELGIGPPERNEDFVEWGDFLIAQAHDAKPLTQGLHVGFVAPSREHVDAFHRAGVAAGARDDGAPGPRPQYSDDYYGGFLLDLDGNSAEAVTHGFLRSDGVVDHLWVRVADLAASRRFYDAITPFARLQRVADEPTLVRYRRTGTGGGSLTLVQGEQPTVDVHIAFSADDDATVQAFHEAIVAAGYRDDGAPGLRDHYSPGYYGAFVLDPDGNSVELVHHHYARGAGR